MKQELENVKKSDIMSNVIEFVLTAGFFAVLFIICLPTLLIFSEGHDGEITVWNFVGIAWLLILVKIAHYVIKKKHNG